MKYRTRKKLKRWAKFVPIPLVLIAGGLAYANYIGGTPATGGEPQAACVLVVDRTSSIDSDATEQRNRRLVRTMVDGCAEREAQLVAYVFSQDGPKATVVGTYDLFPPEFRSTARQQTEIEDQKEAAIEEISALYDEETGDERGSDILTPISTAASNLQTSPTLQDVDEQYVVVLTDGIQISSDISLASLESPDDPLEPLVQRAVDNGLIPDVEGMSVTLVGLRGGEADTGDPLPDWFEARVEEFWTDVIERGGGALCPPGSDNPELPLVCT